jgi:hypothetical protein
MTHGNLSFFDYVKAAFHWKVKISGLGYLPLNRMLLAGFAILGFGNFGFWFLGIAYETGYLLFLSGSPRFQKLVRGSELKSSQQQWYDKQARLMASLDKPSQERYRRLEQASSGILKTAKSTWDESGMAGVQSGDLSQLLWIFLRLLHSCQRIKKILSQTSRQDLEQEMKAITLKLAKEPETSPVYRSLKGILDIQQRRLDNLIKAEESLMVSESELNRIEKQVELIAEEITVSSDPEILSLRLDGVMQSLQGTTSWMSEHSEFFGAADEYPASGRLLSEAEHSISRSKG